MTKEVSIFPFEDEVIISSSFVLYRGHSAWEDAVSDSFKTIIRSFDEDAVYDDKQVSLIPEVNLEELKAKFEKYGFTVKEKKFSLTEKLTEEQANTAPTETLVFNETLQLKDIQNYIDKGREFNPLVRIGATARLGDIVKKTFDSYKFEDKDFYFIPIGEFVELVEKANKFILRLSPKFKGNPSLDKLLEWRTGDYSKVYKEIYKKYPAETLQAGQILDGYEIIEGFRMYIYLYKFGSKNIKHYGRYNDWIFLKPFRWDYILFIKRSFLLNNDNTTVIGLSQSSVAP